MRRWSIGIMVLLLLLGCSGQGTFYVTIEFPEVETEAAKEQTRLVRIMAIEPSGEAGCQALLDGTFQPGDDGYPVEDSVDVGYPGMEGARPLKTKGSGPRLFFVEAEDENGLVILRGCTPAQAGGSGSREVVIRLEWAGQPCQSDPECDDGQWCNGEEHCVDGRCESGSRDCDDGDVCTRDECNEDLDRCDNPRVTDPPAEEGPIGDATCSDGVDNDCDGLTDGGDPACIACSQDSECDDLNSCTSDVCTGGQCVNDPLADGTNCDDGLYCTEGDLCTGGMCGGGDRDCSGVEDQCNRSVCDEVGGVCFPIPLADGTGCDDGQWCTEADACSGGACLGQAQDCSTYDGPCVRGVCNEAAQACEGQDVPDGTGCDDGLYCSVGEMCQSGSCTGGTARDCSASGGGCVDGACDEDADLCVGDPLAAGTPCDDGVNCTEDDACDGAGGCVGTAVDCSVLSNQCNLGVCEEVSGACVRQSVNEGQGCNDGLYCTVGESCQSGSCTGGADLVCNDDDGCTQDSCDEANDVCYFDLVEIPGAEGLSVAGTCSDQIDNDCDRQVDDADPDCQECSVNSDCDDGNPCTINACVGIQCQTALAADGTPCDDAEYCTDPDTCTAGSCGGPDLDCSSLDDQCNQGLCNETDDSCQAQPINEGQPCDDGLYCTEAEECLLGSCTGGTGLDCSGVGDDCHVGVCDDDIDACVPQPGNEGLPCDDGIYCNVGETCQSGSCGGGTQRDCSAFEDECNSALCSEVAGACVTAPRAAGTPCQDGIGCTTGDTCDGNGNCVGTRNDAFCPGPGQQCWPDCFTDPTGCGFPPGNLVLLCSPNPVDLATTDTTFCDMGLGLTGQLDCLYCYSRLSMATLDIVGFDNCDLGGWSLVSADECSTSVSGCSSWGSQDCCDEVGDICGEYNGNYRLKADEATNCQAGPGFPEQFRLQKTFDFTGLANIETCFEIADRNADNDEGVLVYACDAANGCEQIFCQIGEPQHYVDWTYYRYCAVLPQWADDNPAVTIKFVVHSDDPDDIMYLDDISVRGWSVGCTPAYLQAFMEEFDGCPDPLSDGWNGWTVTGDVECRPDFNCYDGSDRARVRFNSGSFERFVDASALDDDIELCFYYGDDNADSGETLTVEFNSGAGWQLAWYQDGNPGPDMSCRQICVNLTDKDPAVKNNPSLGIRFNMVSDAPGDELHLDHITLEGAVYCDGSGLIEIGALTDNGNGTYFFTARDIPGTTLRADIECYWADPDTGISGSDTVLYQE